MFWHHKKYSEEEKAEWKKHRRWHQKGGGMWVQFLAFLGALIYFEQQAHGFGQVLLAFIKAVFWPALLVYGLLNHLHL